jgi:two pore calcium channel protein
MLFYAWFGVVMFVDSPEGDQLFPNLVEGLWTLWICVTTANYPDVMMPGYTQNRFVALYFVSFMILTFFFLMNVILATVCNEYDTSVAEHRVESTKLSTTNLKKAFSLLMRHENESTSKDSSMGSFDTIDRETVIDLLTILNNDFPEFRRLSQDDTHILFAILDRDGTSNISEQEFMNFGNVLMLELCKTSHYASSIEIYFPIIFHSHCWQHFRRCIMSPYFEYIIDFILILNAIVVGIQSWPLLSDEKVVLDSKLLDGSIDTIWGTYGLAFQFLLGLRIRKLIHSGFRIFILLASRSDGNDFYGHLCVRSIL